MALFAPMPSASVNIAIAVKLGAFTSMRSANFKFAIILFLQNRCHHS
jgi:hypothetical protein